MLLLVKRLVCPNEMRSGSVAQPMLASAPNSAVEASDVFFSSEVPAVVVSLAELHSFACCPTDALIRLSPNRTVARVLDRVPAVDCYYLKPLALRHTHSLLLRRGRGTLQS